MFFPYCAGYGRCDTFAMCLNLPFIFTARCFGSMCLALGRQGMSIRQELTLGQHI